MLISLESDAQALRLDVEAARDSSLAQKLSADAKLREMRAILANDITPNHEATIAA